MKLASGWLKVEGVKPWPPYYIPTCWRVIAVSPSERCYEVGKLVVIDVGGTKVELSCDDGGYTWIVRDADVICEVEHWPLEQETP